MREDVLQIARDELFHDFVCATVDALHTGVRPHFADGVFLHKAVAAVQLQAFIQHFALGVGQPVFGHRRTVDRQLAAQVFCDTLIKEGAGDDGFGFAFGQFEAGVLKLGERATKGFAFLAIFDGALDGTFHSADRFAGDDQALLGQLFHHLVKAFALFAAKNVFWRDFDVVKEQLGRVGRVLADFIKVAAALKASGTFGFDHNKADAFGPFSRVGFGCNDDQISVLAVGDERLLARQAVGVAVFDGFGFDRLHV